MSCHCFRVMPPKIPLAKLAATRPWLFSSGVYESVGRTRMSYAALKFLVIVPLICRSPVFTAAVSIVKLTAATKIPAPRVRVLLRRCRSWLKRNRLTRREALVSEGPSFLRYPPSHQVPPDHQHG